MDWLTPIDIYCERTSTLFWAEPVNAISNGAFILAAIWGAITARARAENNPLVWLLIAIAASIGVGSFLFHTFANHWSELTDVLPIWTFVALYVFVSIHRMAGVKPGKLMAVALAIVAALVVFKMTLTGDEPATTALPVTPDLLNGSGQYAPAVVALVILAVFMVARRHPQRGWVLGATAAFAISLTFRTIDLQVCGGFPLGTHFIWHSMNGVLIALLLQMLVRARPVSVKQT